MPKSKVRKKPSYSATPAAASGPSASNKQLRPSPTWYPVTLVVLLVVGLAYIVVYYMAGEHVPLMKDLGSWNFGVGFVFLLSGLIMAVRWR
ncbi:cell division protein CrgA [Jatrophihabitans telluris]|uniref:Cell division protein CrgA n=1 Tax=Jatrophihabitans telluris TaxID=2038343 RepID=A0ABY4QZ22_9ACTN|nr:cell division protein CrgA [Jatrophihabitans telluris]UQX88573.1 cell division protein CrgA [Jatrophihabitans telluris]